MYLQSIEEEDWSAIAAPVYVRGFIRTYARFLGLDPEAAVEAYNADVEAVERESDGPLRVAPARSRGPSIWIWLAAAAAVVLLCFVGYSYYQLQTSGSATSPAPDLAASAVPGATDAAATSGSPEPGTAAGSPEPSPVLGASPEPSALDSGSPLAAAASAAPEPSASGALSKAPSAAKVAVPPGSDVGDLVTTPSPVPSETPAATASLVVVVTDRAWVRVDIDGHQKMEGIYPAGTRKTFHGGKSAYVRTGNAGGVLLVVDGKNLGKMGPGGEVVEKTYALAEE